MRTAGPPRAQHLLGAEDLGVERLQQLLDLTDSFAEVARRPMPKVPALRAKTVVLAFFEDSTRTRLSFDLAAKRLSADTLTFSAAASSLSKGESVRDTVETIAAMGVDAIVVRHRNAGVPQQVARWLDDRVSVVNAGDGAHQHPTQALQDAYTLCTHLGRAPAAGGGAAGGGAAGGWNLVGLRVGIVGDVAHSRVARSAVAVYAALGATVTLIAPPTLLPACLDGWPADVAHDFDEVIADLDVVGLLRLQHERMGEAQIGPISDYVRSYGLTAERARRLAPGAVITHPGPVNRGVEVAADVLDGCPTALVTRQVTHGVAARMAVLFRLLGEEPAAPAEPVPAGAAAGPNSGSSDSGGPQ
ncbi:MAG TPA: aspartate carbamoyltransferase [Acidimicrobiaceae bacterium]|nr:aspartate carbamoyltransferase [Acidimicrobiaceae bacterium]HCB36837.1 aspartate carbamoyltransferase [Acidimicrobiaceae bacterium]